MVGTAKTVRVIKPETESKDTKNGNSAKQNESWRGPESAGDTYAKRMREKFAAAKEQKNQQNQEAKNKAAEEKQNETKNEDNSTNELADITKQLREAKRQLNAAKKQIKQQQEQIKKQQQNLVDFNKSFMQRNKDLQAAEDSNKRLQAEGNQKSEAIQTLNDNLKASSDKNERLSKRYQDSLTQNSILTESIRQSNLKSPEEVDQARKELESLEPKAEEVKTDNSGTTEETVAPETGEAKVEGESKANTEQAQATQEPAKEANARPGTGEATADNMMTPEDAYNYFKNKDNYEKASNVFETPSFNEYIDSNTGKWIPRGYFDAYNAKDGINPKKFTFEHFKAKIPEDLSKKLTSAEATEELAKRNAALKSYEEEYKKYNTGFQAYLRKHPKLANIIKWGAFGALGEGAVEFGKWLNETYMAGQNDKDEVQNIIDRLNDDDPEPLVGNVNNNSPENIAAQLKGADESTETSEGDSGTIEQAIAEQAPADNVEPENPQVTANAATSTNTKANNAPANTAESAPTQGLPLAVTRDAPPANPDSSGMTYSQRVEAEGQAPKAGSMAYNANNPDMVTAGLIDAMNQNPQAGSDAIGYRDLYDQNFIDFWAKRNPNLAYAVSQGRKS